MSSTVGISVTCDHRVLPQTSDEQGHDLMSMFPARSPMTVRMQLDSRCRAFEQQERAFFALPETVNNSVQAPLVQMAIKRTVYGCIPRPTRTIEHPFPCRDVALKEDCLKSATRPSARSPPVLPRPRQLSSTVFTGSARRARRQATKSIHRPVQRRQTSQASGSHAQVVSAVQARRVDKATGVTWIEVEYRARSSQFEQLYSFQNIVSEANPS